MTKLELQYKELQIIILCIEKLLKAVKTKAYQDADEWLKLFKYQQPIAHKKASACSANKDLVVNIKRCYKETEQFLKTYLNQRYKISTQSEKELFEFCYTKDIITRDEKNLLQEMAIDIDALCSLCNEKGNAVVSAELIQYYHTMLEIIERMNIFD